LHFLLTKGDEINRELSLIFKGREKKYAPLQEIIFRCAASPEGHYFPGFSKSNLDKTDGNMIKYIWEE